MFSSLSNRLTEIVKNLTGKGRLTENNIRDTLQEIKISLLEADVPIFVVKNFLDQIQKQALGERVIGSLRPGDTLTKIVYDELVNTLGQQTAPLNLQTQPPAIILVVGLQGGGKTTTVAKLANWIQTTQKKSVLVASADIYRPAAMEQLRVLAEQIGVGYCPATNQDRPLAIVQTAIELARKQLSDVLIIDTAGRLHIDPTMMQELQALHKTAAPIETLLTVDSMTGQDALNIAQTFAQTIPLTGVILTKTDGDARGGAALAMRMVTQQPIKFIGTGEQVTAFEPFYPDRIASRILGMGDILSLVEEVHQKIDQEKTQKLARKFQKGKAFDLEDFRTQLQQMRKLGGVAGLVSKLPKLGNIPKIDHEASDYALVQMEAIINSMTPRERHFPAFIKGSHRRRIAAGSGTNVTDVNRLLRQFEQMQKMLQRFKGNKMQNILRQFS